MARSVHKLFLYGGSFNPPHLGHRKVVEFVLKKENFDLFLLIPAAESPFKKKEELLPFKVRFYLLKVLFGDLFSRKFKITRLENHLPKPNYTLNTLMYLKKCFPQSEFFFILGKDSFLSLPLWYGYEKLTGLTHFYVLKRGEDEVSLPGDFEKQISYQFAENPLWEVSSTLIRSWLQDYYLAEEYQDVYLKGWIEGLLKEKLSDKVFAEIIKNKYYYPTDRFKEV